MIKFEDAKAALARPSRGFIIRIAQATAILLCVLAIGSLSSQHVRDRLPLSHTGDASHKPSKGTSASSSTTYTLQNPAAIGAECTHSLERGKCWPGWAGIKNIFAFGDSYTDMAFIVDGPQPTPENPFGNFFGNAVPQELAANTNWLVFLGLHQNESQVMIYDFAVGGSTLAPTLVRPLSDSAEGSFLAQLEEKWLEHYAKRPEDAPWTSGDSLFAFWFGVNDVIQGSLVLDHTPVEREFRRFRLRLQSLYNTGARNFLFLNVPPINRGFSSGPKEVEASDVADWNRVLPETIADFAAEHEDVSTFVFDVCGLWLDVLRDPSVESATAGIMNTTDYCIAYQYGTDSYDTLSPECGVAVNEYFWINSIHTTYPIMNATAVRIRQDCFGAGGKTGYCS